MRSAKPIVLAYNAPGNARRNCVLSESGAVLYNDSGAYEDSNVSITAYQEHVVIKAPGTYTVCYRKGTDDKIYTTSYTVVSSPVEVYASGDDIRAHYVAVFKQ